MYSIDELNAKNVAQLKDIAKEIGAKIKSNDNKKTIVYAILDPGRDARPECCCSQEKESEDSKEGRQGVLREGQGR